MSKLPAHHWTHWSWTQCVLAIAALILVPAVADAGVELDATQLRHYELPEGFTLDGNQLQAAPNGDTVLWATTGEETLACTIVTVDGDGATSISYQYQGVSTTCASVLPHPDSGFFVRGGRAEFEEGEVFGFTARISADGEEMWATDDSLLVDESGSGEFYANYAQPHPEMAYSAEFDYLLGYTAGTINVGGEQFIAEGHVLKGESGNVRVTGWTFQGTGSPGFVAESVARTSDGYFLLYIYNAGSRGAHFFSFNGRNSNDKFEPLGEDWSQRYVRQMIYGPDDNVHLLWTPGDAGDSPTAVTVVEDTADDSFHAAEVWDQTYEPSVEADFADATLDLGLPGGMWVGAEFSLILYGTDEGLVLRVLDGATGDELGVAPLEGLTDYAPVAILNGEGGGLKLLTFDEDSGRVHEFALGITETDGEGGGDAGFGDAGDAGSSGDSSGGGDDGCTTGSPTTPGPVGAALLAIGLGVVTIARRRRLNARE